MSAARVERGATDRQNSDVSKGRSRFMSKPLRSFETSATSRTASHSRRLAPSASLLEPATSRNEELCDSCSSPDIWREGKMGGTCNTQGYEILVGKLGGKRHFGRRSVNERMMVLIFTLDCVRV